MASIKDLRLRIGERGAIIGRTGTGKSVLAQSLIPGEGRLAIIDPKRMFNYPVDIFHSYKDILKRKPKRFMYRPNEQEFDNIEAYDSVYKYIFDCGKFFVYTDEIVSVIDNSTPPRYLRLLYQLGREKRISILSTFQRPKSVPLFLMSESNKFYPFRLTLTDDIKRVKQFVPGYTGKLSDDHTFMYFDDKTMECGIETKLKLAERS